jgi:hypothetical protein
MEENADILWYQEILVFVICSFHLHIVHTMATRHILHTNLEPILQPSYAARCSHCTVHVADDIVPYRPCQSIYCR